MQHQFGLCSFKFDYICGPKRKCFVSLSLSPDKNAGKSVAWSTDSSFVRLGKINAENEIHPLIMEGRVDASSAPKPNPAATDEDHKRWREMRRERSNSNAQNGRPRRRRRGHRKAGKKIG